MVCAVAMQAASMREVLGEIFAAAIPRAEQRRLAGLAVQVALRRQPEALDKEAKPATHSSEGPLIDIERILTLLGDGVSKAGLGAAKRELRERGGVVLAARLGRLSRVRNSCAHPDVALYNDIVQVLARGAGLVGDGGDSDDLAAGADAAAGAERVQDVAGDVAGQCGLVFDIYDVSADVAVQCGSSADSLVESGLQAEYFLVESPSLPESLDRVCLADPFALSDDLLSRTYVAALGFVRRVHAHTVSHRPRLEARVREEFGQAQDLDALVALARREHIYGLSGMELVDVILSGWPKKRVKKFASLHGICRDNDSDSLCADVIMFLQERAGHDA